MLCFLPEEVLGVVLEFADPSWVCSLTIANKFFHNYVQHFYKHNAPIFLRPAGIWHHSIKNKRTRTSLENPSQMISYAPMGLYSILHQQCVGCKKKYMASVHKDFGVIVHPHCLRPFLINIYYFEKFGLDKTHFQYIPSSELSGYSAGFYGRGNYSYTAVWKDTTAKGIVPYEWTAHYVFHHRCLDFVRNFLAEKRRKEQEEYERKQALKEEKKRLRKEATKQIRLLYQERMKKLMDDMKPVLTPKQIRTVLRTKLPEVFMSRFFQRVDVPPDFFTPEDDKDAADVVLNIHRLMEHLTFSEISSLKYNDLGKSIETLCRAEVQCVLGGIVEKIHQEHTPSIKRFKNIIHFPPRDCGCGRAANTRCFKGKCGICCRGCRCHMRR